MHWVDIAGPPGGGKSTLCYPIWGDRSVTWDGKLPPAYWRPFLDEITALCGLVQDHPSFQAVLRMNDRSAKKMATVERMPAPHKASQQGIVFGDVEGVLFGEDTLLCKTFVQTGLVQRILGFGWRLAEMGRDVNLIRTALWRMPVSVGVVFLEADLETLRARNREREKTPATAHENRSHQIPFMLEAIPIAKDVLHARAIPVLDLDVQHQPIEAARAQLLDFAAKGPCLAAQVGRCPEVSLLSPPAWWR